MNKKQIHFVDLLHQSELDAPSPHHIEIQRMVINRDSRTVLFQHPDSNLLFPEIHIGKKARITTALGVRDNVWDRCKCSIRFFLEAETNEGRKVLFQEVLAPGKKESDQCWREVEIDLSDLAGQKVRIRMRTMADGDPAYAWSAWSDPRLEHLISDARPVIHRKKQKHVFLITSDALSRRFLGCYGGDEVPTPHIDTFAERSILFENAVSQSTTTLGSYASMLSGVSPDQHLLRTEWGCFPSGTMSLPVFLQAQGYRTALFTSETELYRSAFGFSSLFQDCFNALSNPAQDGAITLRTFQKYWDSRPDQPLFTWLQFFDTHPPSLPPREISKAFYEGDPTKIEKNPNMVSKVYGLESLVEMERILPLLNEGHPMPGQAVARFKATALTLQGKQENGPDLFEHLLRCPDTARLGKSPLAFGHWLDNQMSYLEEEGKPHADFIAWMKIAIPELQFIQTSITSWLKGVTDFSYAEKQYQACTYYFDQHIGRLFDFLKDTDTYDDSVILLTSPHGEIIHFQDVAFHHHLPHPYVYDVPLIVKAAGQTTGRRIKGLTQHRDIFPSVLDGLGLNEVIPASVTGKSWWPSVSTGETVGRTWSESFDISDVLSAIYDPPYLYVKSNLPFHLSGSWYGKADEAYLFQVDKSQEGMHQVDEPEVMERLALRIKKYDKQIKIISSQKK